MLFGAYFVLEERNPQGRMDWDVRVSSLNREEMMVKFLS